MLTNRVNGHGKKRAGVTVELLLAILLAVVVLFFVLSIFGDNLKTMVANSGIQNMFDNGQKTTFGKQAFDPTQVNVQVLAEQGNTLKTLDDFKKAAADKIKYYTDNPPQNEDQVLDLAKWATIARITTGSQVLTPRDYETLLVPNGIDIDDADTYTTTIGTANINGSAIAINKQFTYRNSSTNATGPDYQLAKAKTIINAQYQQSSSN